MGKKLTIKELLAQKEQIKAKKARAIELHIDSLDGEITIQEPSRALAIEAIGMTQDVAKSDFADIYVVYNCVIEPNLKDKDLQREFGCVEPTDIVTMLFKPGEISSISDHAMKLAGYGGSVKKVDAELKN